MIGYQVECRCRLRGQLGQVLHDMPRAGRSRVIAALLASVAEGIDLQKLLESREELRRVGVLLNQSLSFLHARTGNADNHAARVVLALELIDSLCAKKEVGGQCER